jgi:hypothetical protein
VTFDDVRLLGLVNVVKVLEQNLFGDQNKIRVWCIARGQYLSEI